MTSIIGIDWATDPHKRALVQLDLPEDGRMYYVARVMGHVKDADVERECTTANNAVVAVDTPFGWPTKFREFVAAWSPTRAALTPPESDEFRFRLTDRIIRDDVHKEPLSVAADRIALSARAFAKILARPHLAGRVDVEGELRPAGPTIIEVYPGASAWVLGGVSTSRGLRNLASKYKGTSDARKRLVKHVATLLHIHVAGHLGQIVGEGDRSDETDAFLAAVTGAVYFSEVGDRKRLGVGWQIRRPESDAEKNAARTEGWIFFPQRPR